MSLGKICNTTVRKSIREKIVKQELGHNSYLIKNEEAYIEATKAIEGAHGLPRDISTISDELQKFLHGAVR